jgi:hypothetical protein
MPNRLIGKTIKSAEIKKLSEKYDDEPYLDLTFTDGSSIRIMANYGGYTGKSDGEYPRFILIKENENEKE